MPHTIHFPTLQTHSGMVPAIVKSILLQEGIEECLMTALPLGQSWARTKQQTTNTPNKSPKRNHPTHSIID
jgi:hypothetical protein